MAGSRRRPGPKPAGPFEDKRRTISTRITDETRERLEKAAADSGRSLSQEIELRLVQSFEIEKTIASVAETVGGRALLWAERCQEQARDALAGERRAWEMWAQATARQEKFLEVAESVVKGYESLRSNLEDLQRSVSERQGGNG